MAGESRRHPGCAGQGPLRRHPEVMAQEAEGGKEIKRNQISPRLLTFQYAAL